LTEPAASSTTQSFSQSALSWEFFQDLPAERNAFYQMSRLRRVSKKEIVVMEGALANSVLYIVEGQVIVTRTSAGGKEVALYIHKKGALLGLPGSLLNLPRSITARALTPGIVYEVHSSDFRSLIAKFPVLNERIMLQHYLSLDFIMGLYLSAFSDDAEIRLKKLLARLFSEELLKLKPDKPTDSISLTITQDELACAIGVSRAMISRVLQRMQTEGLIAKSAHKISFLKPEQFLSYLEISSTQSS
jgi:CRP/FNR family transcriptional regulator, cyclic AMP receptor protein